MMPHASSSTTLTRRGSLMVLAGDTSFVEEEEAFDDGSEEEVMAEERRQLCDTVEKALVPEGPYCSLKDRKKAMKREEEEERAKRDEQRPNQGMLIPTYDEIRDESKRVSGRIFVLHSEKLFLPIIRLILLPAIMVHK